MSIGCRIPRVPRVGSLTLPMAAPKRLQLADSTRVLIEVAALEISAVGPESLTIGRPGPLGLAGLLVAGHAAELMAAPCTTAQVTQGFCPKVSDLPACSINGGPASAHAVVFVEPSPEGSAEIQVEVSPGVQPAETHRVTIPWPVQGLIALVCRLSTQPVPRTHLLLLRVQPLASD